MYRVKLLTMKNSVALAAGVLTLAASSYSQITQSGSTYSIKMKHSVGQVLRYSMKMAINSPAVPGGKMAMTMQMESKTTKVSGGLATVKTKLSGMSLNGKPSKMGQSEVETVVDSLGKIVNGTGASQGMNASFPTKPVKIGESWTSTNTVPGPGGQPMKAKAVYTLKSVGVVGGKKVATIGVVLNSTGGMKMSGTGTQMILADDGSMLSATMIMDMELGANKMKMNMLISRK